ncbi:MAG: hypothetical protein ABMA01_24200 [Chthoniobacteraceae bacterium]
MKTIFPICALALAIAAAGCKPVGVRVYDAPRDKPFVPSTENPPEEKTAAAPEQEVWRPALSWTLPPGWKDLGPDPANVGRFSAGTANVAITALTSMEGKETLLVNMWRQVRGQPPLEEAESAKMLQNVPIGSATGMMFEVSDTEAEKPTRFVVAFVHRPEGSLFFKIQGADSEVAGQKAAFLEFLKSIQFTGGAAAAPAPKPAAEGPAWPGHAPAEWTPVAPGPMQHAKFTVPGKDSAQTVPSVYLIKIVDGKVTKF